MYDNQPQAESPSAASKGVPVYKRMLDLFEAEGIKTLFGIPDPNFVHLFLEAEMRGWTVVSPHHEASAGHMAAAAARRAWRYSTVPSRRVLASSRFRAPHCGQRNSGPCPSFLISTSSGDHCAPQGWF